MPFDYEANVAAIKNALEDYNTSTASPDLSSGLTRRIQNVYVDDPEIVSIRQLSYPALFVRISSKEESYASAGVPGPSGNKKFATTVYDVIGLYHKDGAHTQHSGVLTEIYRLAENIEGVFQAEHDLSSTALWCNPRRTEFVGPFSADGAWVKAVLVELEARYLFR